MSMVMKTLSPFRLLSPPIDMSVLVPSSLLFAKFEVSKTHDRFWGKKVYVPQSLLLSKNERVLGATRVAFCRADNVSEEKFSDNEELGLLSKPSPIPIVEYVDEPVKPNRDEALEPFLKFFKSSELEEEHVEEKESVDESEAVSEKVVVEYYDPQPGDFVVGVVVSGNENKLDVNVGADLLGTMLTKEVLPLDDKEMDYLVCDLDKDVEEIMASGKMGIIQQGDSVIGKPTSGRPVVDVGSVVLAEVLGRTLSGRPLLSSRRYFRRIAWDRVRQIEQVGEPIQVRITQWNTGGLLTRLEGLRAFVPKVELVDKISNFTDLKNKVGSKMYVLINRINEDTNDLILSEREAWEKVYLREGSLLEGIVTKILPYGAQVQLGQTKRSGLLHASNISLGKFNAVSDVLAVGEKVKVMVIKSLVPDRISLSIADLESAPGLFISDKEKVFEEAEEMARRYRRKRPSVPKTRKSKPSVTTTTTNKSSEDGQSVFANWAWFVFQRENEQ